MIYEEEMFRSKKLNCIEWQARCIKSRWYDSAAVFWFSVVLVLLSTDKHVEYSQMKNTPSEKSKPAKSDCFYFVKSVNWVNIFSTDYTVVVFVSFRKFWFLSFLLKCIESSFISFAESTKKIHPSPVISFFNIVISDSFSLYHNIFKYCETTYTVPQDSIHITCLLVC